MICVDPGVAHIGAVVIDPTKPLGQDLVAARYFHTTKNSRKVPWRHADDQARRCQEIARFYRDLVLEFGIKRAAAELPTGGAPNSAGATDLARAGAVLVAVLELLSVAVEWYAPDEPKAAIGRRGATKKQVMEAIRKIYPAIAEQFPALERQEHVADAAALWLAARHGVLAKL